MTSFRTYHARGHNSYLIEVGGKRLEVVLPAGLGFARAGATRGSAARGPRRRRTPAAAPLASSGMLTAPMQGTVVKIAVEDGAEVAEGDLLVVLEAMKMEQPLTAHRAGTVKLLGVEVGTTVTSGTALVEIV